MAWVIQWSSTRNYKGYKIPFGCMLWGINSYYSGHEGWVPCEDSWRIKIYDNLETAKRRASKLRKLREAKSREWKIEVIEVFPIRKPHK